MTDEMKLKILVVDDERSNIDALAYILKPRYSVLVAKDGRTGIEIARTNKPDLILLDVMMPGMSGFQVLTELKSADQTRGIPVIFITGLDNADDEELGFSLGAVDYITKPFHNSIVKARVRIHLQMVEYIRTIERLSMIDALTNIPNRRSFDTRIKGEWDRAIREKAIISMLMIDIDDFKLYNDRCGHMHGDELLKTVSGIFEDTLRRPADFVARWGGEEFAVLLPGTNLEGALTVAENIRANVEHKRFPCPDGTVTTVTISIGVNAERPAEESKIDAFIEGADSALYVAKAAGKNTVRSAMSAIIYPIGQ